MYLRKRNFVISVLVFVSISCGSFTSEEVSVAKDNEAPEAEKALLVSNAESLYRERGDLGKARAAIVAIGKARNQNARDYEVERIFAEYSYFLGSRESVSHEESTTVLKKGLEAARIASRMKPEKPDGHFWIGAILGEQSKRSPITVGLISIDPIRKVMQKVIEIDPSFKGASAYDALAQVELATKGLAGGSPAKALEHLLKALELSKKNSYVRLHLGEAYLALKQPSEAKKHLEAVLSMVPNNEFLPEHEEVTRRARELLRKKY